MNLQDITLNSGSCTKGVLGVIWQFNKEMACGKKKLFLCLDVLVSSVLSHRPDGNSSSRLWPGWVGSVMFLPALFLVEGYRSWRLGRGHQKSSLQSVLLVVASCSWTKPDSYRWTHDSRVELCQQVELPQLGFLLWKRPSRGCTSFATF